MIILNPADWEIVRLLKDTANQYLGGGPFSGSYGGSGGQVQASGQVTGAADGIWNKATYVTSALGAGTALVGSSQAAKVWNRGGLSVEVTNSHTRPSGSQALMAEAAGGSRRRSRPSRTTYRPHPHG